VGDIAQTSYKRRRIFFTEESITLEYVLMASSTTIKALQYDFRFGTSSNCGGGEAFAVDVYADRMTGAFLYFPVGDPVGSGCIH